MKAESVRRYELSTDQVDIRPPAETESVELDEHGWPVSAIWPGMDKPLFVAGTGDFQSVAVTGFAGRWACLRIFGTTDGAAREKLRTERLRVEDAVPRGPAVIQRNPHTTVYTQELEHSRLRWLVRELELWHDTPRARLTMRLHRTSSELPELFFATFAVPCHGTLPTTTNGGLPFVPYQDQLPGTCRDYVSIDQWLDYATPGGHWLWATRDVPLVTLGGHQVLARGDEAPAETGRVLAMLFNNIWFTNFVADSHGALEFQFDLAWTPSGDDSAGHGIIAEALQSEPTVVINVPPREHPIFMRRLHR
jgi:hypothetical protein